MIFGMDRCLNEIGNANNNDVTAVGNRATLGGSWNSARQDTVVAHRGGYDLRYRNLNTGFRVIRAGFAIET